MSGENPNQFINDQMKNLGQLSKNLTDSVLPELKKAQKQLEVVDKAMVGSHEISINRSGVVMITGANKEVFEKIKSLLS